MPKKTNKTSHVLNLITNGAGPEETKEGALSQDTEANPEASASGAALEAEGASSPQGTAPVSETAPASAQASGDTSSAPAAAPASAPVVPSVAKEATVVVVDAQDDQVSEKILDNLTSQLSESEPEEEDDCHIVNVMEDIINRTNLKQYMDQYEVCHCSRCCADVKALILTRLPAKYVVVHKDSVAPIIGFYENKFKTRIFTEILKSCMQVKENPRHKQ